MPNCCTNTWTPRRPKTLACLGSFALGALAATLALRGWTPTGDAATAASRLDGVSGPGFQVIEQGQEPNAAIDRATSWLPTRTFACPRCGTDVPTNDNSLPILLLGFLGQGAFGLRFFVQWIASERAKASVIPVAFWWLSIGGGLFLMLYGWALLAWPIILGQGLNCLIYGRNLALLSRHHAPLPRRPEP